MVDVAGIRALSEDEKRIGGIREIGSPDARKNFSRRVHDKEQEYTRDHKPFCRRCALLDYERARQAYKEPTT